MAGNASEARIADEILDRFVAAVAYRLRYFRQGSKKIHAAPYGKELMLGRQPYFLCDLPWQEPVMVVGGKYTDPNVCRQCTERLRILAGKVARAHNRDLWALATGGRFVVTVAELREVLSEPGIWGEFNQGGEMALLFDESEVKRPAPMRREW